MLIKKKDYDSLKDECSKLQDEMLFYRSKYKDEVKAREKLEEKLEHMYEQARADAATRSRFADEAKSLGKDVQRLEQKLRDVRLLKFKDIKEYLNPEPTDPEERKLYVSRISGYFRGGLTEYLNYTRSMFQAEISRFPVTERESDFYRAGVNLCYLLNEWGERMITEHEANLRGEDDTVDAFDATPEEEKAVENIEEAINR
jgi:hypothetical protein